MTKEARLKYAVENIRNIYKEAQEALQKKRSDANYEAISKAGP